MLLQQKQQEGSGGPLAFKLHNPFALRVGQVFTGFGVGCGIGIGFGRAINIRAIPVLGNVAGEAISSFSGMRHHVQSLGKRLGVKNVQAGVGCGVGVGHGFGIGVTLKPGTVQQLKNLVEQGLSTINERVKSVAVSSDVEEGKGNTVESSALVVQEKSSPDLSSLKGSTTDKLLEGFLQSSPRAATREQGRQESNHGEVERLQTENRILVTLLKHQEQIEVLKEENASLKQALAEERDPSLKPKASSDDVDHSVEGKLCNSRTKCFECRRRSRQGR
eukprot:c18578_g1_i2 orf=153-980(+)